MVSTRRQLNVGVNKRAFNEPVDHSESEGRTDIRAFVRKRPRTVRTAEKVVSKPRTKVKQAEVKGLTKLPVELLMEIARLVAPGDLIALVRTNWSFRRMLLSSSSIKIWQNALDGVPELPKCPYESMSEPAYAALVFSKHCTYCGVTTFIRPDAHLGLRLCASCRDTELVELNPRFGDRWSPVYDLVNFALDYRSDRDMTDTKWVKGSVYALRSEAERVLATRAGYLRKRERKQLAEYEESLRKAIEDNHKRYKVIHAFYLDSESDGRIQRDTVKSSRKEMITERLGDLGWTERDMLFDRLHAKPWRELVEIPKPLTERVWTNILPKLITLLEENRERNNLYDAKERRVKRRARMDQFLTDLKYTEHPYAVILEVLGKPVPEPLTQKEYTVAVTSVFFRIKLGKRLGAVNPFPKTEVVLGWDLFKDLDEDDISVEEVERKFSERKPEITDAVARWRTLVEEKLVERYEFKGTEATLLVKHNTDLTSQLSQNSRFLLRADVIFKHVSKPTLNWWDDYVRAMHYPDCVSRITDILKESPDSATFAPGQDVDFDNLVRYTEAEVIVKRMLGDIGMPDVAHMELKTMGPVFVCERCRGNKVMSWEDLIEHYLSCSEAYQTAKQSKGKYRLRHPAVFQDVHDPAHSNRPLVRLVSKLGKTNKTNKTNKAIKIQGPHIYRCYVCQNIERTLSLMSEKGIRNHMIDWHAVSDPVESVHFGTKDHKKLGNSWHKTWDQYHDKLEVGCVSK